MGLPGGQGHCQGRPGIRGNQMKFGRPAAPGFANGLGAVFFNAPVPSGWTCTLVLSNETASRVMRTICSRCRYSKTQLQDRGHRLAQRFMRV